MIDMRMYPVNSEVEKWKREMEDKQKGFSFIEIDFLVDMRVAENKYKEEYKKDIGGIRTSQVSFSQWLDYKKFEAAKFHVKHSDYYLGI